jgi:hypothetical protein
MAAQAIILAAVAATRSNVDGATAALSNDGGLECTAVTETTIDVRWDAVDATDVYYVSISSNATTRPLALQTTDVPQVTLIDLNPGMTYYLGVRSHPSVNDIVWGWRAPTSTVSCTTASRRRDRPHALRRVGDAPSERSILVAWERALGEETGSPVLSTRVSSGPAARAVRAAPRERAGATGDARVRGDGFECGGSGCAHEVGVRLLGPYARPAEPWVWEASSEPLAHELGGLRSGEWYEVAVRDAAGQMSEPLRARTAAAGALHTVAYRISEYSFDVDFLENHDGANFGAMPA